MSTYVLHLCFDSENQQDIQNLLGAIYSAVVFLGASNMSSVQGVVSIEKTVFYRERAAGMYSPLPYAVAQVYMNTTLLSYCNHSSSPYNKNTL